MITLFIDTSTDTLTVSIINDDVILDAITLPSSEHSKYAMSAIESIFDKNNIKRNSVNKIMVQASELVLLLQKYMLGHVI